MSEVELNEVDLSMVTKEQFLELKKKWDSAMDDATVYPVFENKEIHLVGDASKTEIKRNNYTILFAFPKVVGKAQPMNSEEKHNAYVRTVHYEDITILPRNNFALAGAIMTLMPFLNKLKEDGGIEDLSKDELFLKFATAKKSIHLAIYNIVAAFLDIDDDEGSYMTPMSVFDTLIKIMDTHPEVFNEADFFTGYSTQE